MEILPYVVPCLASWWCWDNVTSGSKWWHCLVIFFMYFFYYYTQTVPDLFMTVDQYHKRSIRIYLIPLNRVDLTAVPWTITCYRIPVTPVALAVLQVIKLHLCIVNFRRLFIVSYLTACIINLRTFSNKCEMKDSGAGNVPTSHLEVREETAAGTESVFLWSSYTGSETTELCSALVAPSSFTHDRNDMIQWSCRRADGQPAPKC